MADPAKTPLRMTAREFVMTLRSAVSLIKSSAETTLTTCSITPTVVRDCDAAEMTTRQFRPSPGNASGIEAARLGDEWAACA